MKRTITLLSLLLLSSMCLADTYSGPTNKTLNKFTGNYCVFPATPSYASNAGTLQGMTTSQIVAAATSTVPTPDLSAYATKASVSESTTTLYGLIPSTWVAQIQAGNNVTISPSDGRGIVTINASSGGGSLWDIGQYGLFPLSGGTDPSWLTNAYGVCPK